MSVVLSGGVVFELVVVARALRSALVAFAVVMEADDEHTALGLLFLLSYEHAQGSNDHAGHECKDADTCLCGCHDVLLFPTGCIAESDDGAEHQNHASNDDNKPTVSRLSGVAEV